MTIIQGPVARITQMLVENPLALLMRGNKGQSTSDDIGAYTKIAVDDLLEIVIQAEESGGNEEFEVRIDTCNIHVNVKKTICVYSATFPKQHSLGKAKLCSFGRLLLLIG